jgi:adenosylcobinamide-GDP ribazoletransferase
VRSLALALSLLTVVPIQTGAPSGRDAAGALRWAPVVGAAVGALAGLVVWGLASAGTSALVAGLVAVGFLALVTRGMHVDGLADTADGLGSYGPPARALTVMKDGGAGPFAVVTLLVVLGAQAAALAQVDGAGWRTVAVAAVACGVGRTGFCWIARRGVVAARPGGLGALVAGSQPRWVAVTWWVVLAAAGHLVVGWRGPLGVVLAAALTIGLSAHTARRFGGMSGDVLGAASELGTAVVLVVVATAF